MRTQDVEESGLGPLVERGAEGLVVIESPDGALRRKFLGLTAPLTFGRSEEGAAGSPDRIAVGDGRVSSEHASFHWRSDGSGCEVRDLGSRNGTFLDGKRIDCAVAPVGGVVRMGDTFVEVAERPVEVAPHPLLLGRSAPVARLLRDIARVAAGDANLLVEGETGTGKELVVDAIHAQSGRAGKRVAINCAAIPAEIAESYLFGHKKGAFTGASHDSDGPFEQAQDGTLFLDEIGELRLDLQAKLLRVIENRAYTPLGASWPRATNARFVAATNSRLRLAVAAGSFRADLFARLAGVEIAVPSLRRRRCDLPLLMEHFFAQLAPGARYTLSPNAIEALLLHGWPMNVRELKAACGRLALALPSGGRLRTADVAAVIPRAPDGEAAPAGAATASAPSRAELAELLARHHGNVMKLAEHYGKDRRQIYRWLELHRLDPRDAR